MKFPNFVETFTRMSFHNISFIAEKRNCWENDQSDIVVFKLVSAARRPGIVTSPWVARHPGVARRSGVAIRQGVARRPLVEDKIKWWSCPHEYIPYGRIAVCGEMIP